MDKNITLMSIIVGSVKEGKGTNEMPNNINPEQEITIFPMFLAFGVPAMYVGRTEKLKVKD